MTLENIMALVTAIVSLFIGLLAKKYNWLNSKLIPIENLLIGLISAIIYYFITKDISLTITSIGLTTGGTYDIFNNILKLRNEGEYYE